jgi:hypothetical protein
MLRRRLAPVDRHVGARGCPRDGQHCGIRVQAGHGAAGMDQCRSELRHHSSAASSVEDALAGTKARRLQEISRHGRTDARHEITFVVLGRAPYELRVVYLLRHAITSLPKCLGE